MVFFLFWRQNDLRHHGIFVPSWFDSPARTSYRYLQHWMRHPYLWRYLEGGKMRSWGAKTLFESGRKGEPHLVGDGFARIGEGSGSTNVLTGSGVDEDDVGIACLSEGERLAGPHCDDVDGDPELLFERREDGIEEPRVIGARGRGEPERIGGRGARCERRHAHERNSSSQQSTGHHPPEAL